MSMIPPIDPNSETNVIPDGQDNYTDGYAAGQRVRNGSQKAILYTRTSHDYWNGCFDGYNGGSDISKPNAPSILGAGGTAPPVDPNAAGNKIPADKDTYDEGYKAGQRVRNGSQTAIFYPFDKVSTQYYIGTLDGYSGSKYGAGWSSAVEAFSLSGLGATMSRFDHGCDVLGAIDALKTYRRGDKGSDVSEIQSALVGAGFALPKKGVDGVFGPETEDVVRKFQKAKGLQVDGLVGPKTATALGLVITSSIPAVTPTAYAASAPSYAASPINSPAPAPAQVRLTPAGELATTIYTGPFTDQMSYKPLDMVNFAGDYWVAVKDVSSPWYSKTIKKSDWPGGGKDASDGDKWVMVRATPRGEYANAGWRAVDPTSVVVGDGAPAAAPAAKPGMSADNTSFLVNAAAEAVARGIDYGVHKDDAKNAEAAKVADASKQKAVDDVALAEVRRVDNVATTAMATAALAAMTLSAHTAAKAPQTQIDADKTVLAAAEAESKRACASQDTLAGGLSPSVAALRKKAADDVYEKASAEAVKASSALSTKPGDVALKTFADRAGALAAAAQVTAQKAAGVAMRPFDSNQLAQSAAKISQGGSSWWKWALGAGAGVVGIGGGILAYRHFKK